MCMFFNFFLQCLITFTYWYFFDEIISEIVVLVSISIIDV